MRRTLHEAKKRSALSFDELWVRYFGLGGSATNEEVKSFLTSDGLLGREDINTVAQALNEHFLDMGEGMPVPTSSHDLNDWRRTSGARENPERSTSQRGDRHRAKRSGSPTMQIETAGRDHVRP